MADWIYFRHPGDFSSVSQDLSVLWTRKGVHIVDLIMSLIHTAELRGVNPFDYLTELRRHALELKQEPARRWFDE